MFMELAAKGHVPTAVNKYCLYCNYGSDKYDNDFDDHSCEYDDDDVVVAVDLCI